ncbi:kinase-like domain-containing protein [Cyathus striatus]|nr:kinase-like domain-containing protein [Cyathus striatus]
MSQHYDYRIEASQHTQKTTQEEIIQSVLNEQSSHSTSVTSKLNEGELFWRSRYNLLLEKGYKLRPRYKPDWKPSWVETGKDPYTCEDGMFQLLYMVLDAKRLKDGKMVCVKMIESNPREINIARYLSSRMLRHHPDNHCAPAFDAFHDEISPEIGFLVMPMLRPFNDPDFGTVDEIVDFVNQVLEGLAFMHEQKVAHGDCTGANVMMDARPILPTGWHFFANDRGPDGFQSLHPLSRLDHPVKYLFIDFGFSHHYAPGESPLVEEAGGRDSEVPELARHGPWDLYKIDIFTVGNMFQKELLDMYDGLDFLRPLISSMKHRNPENRPTAQQSLTFWYTVKSTTSPGSRRRLHRRDETVGERVVRDTMDAALQSLHQIRRLFRQESFNWSQGSHEYETW